ncbi:MAG TPA: IS110 family transposase [Acidimicrobiales bacterium]|nr:IS110 family transposase [Acidimicrobiales bacterium]
MTSLAHRGLVHLGMDVSRDSISVAVLHPDRDVAEVDKISSDEVSVRRLIKRLGRPSGLWACYEAGPTGYDLYRLLHSIGVRCDVVAPSLIPKGRGDRVKTDKRDSRRLAGLHRAGELAAIAVPTPAQEAVRDLCRTRGDMVEDLTRARNRLGKFLLRHSLIYRGGSNWTIKHHRWLANVHFEDRALAATFMHYQATVNLRDTALEAIEADLVSYFRTEPFADAVLRLGAYRGVTSMGALCLGAEVFDWRRFPRARPFMSFTGLTCSESSSGLSQHRGAITRAGNSHIRGQLTEAAWAYQHRANLGAGLRLRQEGVPATTSARSWRAQTRLCARFHTLASRKNVKSVVATAVARELAGFLWAEMTSQDA